MYCVYCGVRLQDGAPECPLCHTKVMAAPMPEQPKESSYSDRYPRLEKQSGKFLVLGLVTVILAAAALGCMIFCLKSTGKVGWSGIAALGIVLGWIWFVLPLLFPRWRPMIFLPVDFACLGGFLLYICASTGGNWFMIRYIVQGRLRLMSLLLIAIGLSFMLVEFFQHITFGTPMFVWSLYCVSGFCLIGLFLFAASFIPPLRAALRRTFFY